MARILSGKEVCKKLYEELASDISSFDEAPSLLSVVVGDDPASVSYVRAKGRKAEAIGVIFNVLNLPEDSSQDEVEHELQDKIGQFNPDGVIIERPLPEHINFERLTNLVPSVADVDCQRMDSLGKLLLGKAGFVPATAGAVLKILRHYEIPTDGKEVVVVGRSLTVGLPLSVMMLWKGEYANATVTVCHSRTADIAKHAKRAEILVVAAGRPKLVDGNMVSESAVVIDVGTNYIDGKLIGDVDFDSVSERVAAITPVPGGVGPVTTAFLMENLVFAYKKKMGTRK